MFSFFSSPEHKFSYLHGIQGIFSSFFFFFHENICCGYSLEVPHWGTSNEYLQHMFSWKNKKNIYLGPVVQSIVSLTSSLRVILLTVLADSIYNILLFFAEKMWVAFALQKLLTFFSKKFQHICVSLHVNFNESLTNDVVSFEQLGPGYLLLIWSYGMTFEISADNLHECFLLKFFT